MSMCMHTHPTHYTPPKHSPHILTCPFTSFHRHWMDFDQQLWNHLITFLDRMPVSQKIMLEFSFQGNRFWKWDLWGWLGHKNRVLKINVFIGEVSGWYLFLTPGENMLSVDQEPNFTDVKATGILAHWHGICSVQNCKTEASAPQKSRIHRSP